MKRIRSLVLAVIMVATLSVTAFAAEGSDIGNAAGDSATINVSGNFVAGGTAAENISVDVAWGAMEFTYNASSEGSWNTNTHKYDNAIDAFWTASGNEITIINHSNVGITAAFGFVATAGTNVSGAFSADSITLARAEENSALDSQKATVTFEITEGSISADVDSLGTITVTIGTQQAEKVSEVALYVDVTYSGDFDNITSYCVIYYDSNGDELPGTYTSDSTTGTVTVPENAVKFRIVAYTVSTDGGTNSELSSDIMDVPAVSSDVTYKDFSFVVSERAA